MSVKPASLATSTRGVFHLTYFVSSILFIRRIVQIWYTRIGDGEGTSHGIVVCEHLQRGHRFLEKHLVTLRKQQRDKIEEIKKKTNYYSTRNLIERYDEASQANGAADSPLRRRMPGGVSVPATPQRPVQSPPHPQPQPQLVIPQTPVSANGQIPPGLQQHLSRTCSHVNASETADAN